MRPFLIVVSGLPASGKSTLAGSIARDLEVPFLSRDEIRTRVFAEDLGPSVGHLITRTLNYVLDAIFHACGGVVLDSNFNTPQHATGLDELIREHDACSVEICLWADIDVLRQRFIERADPPLTEELRPYFEEVIARDRTPALARADVLIEVDTTAFDELESSYANIIEAIRRETHAGYVR